MGTPISSAAGKPYGFHHVIGDSIMFHRYVRGNGKTMIMGRLSFRERLNFEKSARASNTTSINPMMQRGKWPQLNAVPQQKPETPFHPQGSCGKVNHQAI